MSDSDRQLAIQFAESLQAASGSPPYDIAHHSERMDEMADWSVQHASSYLGGVSEEDAAHIKSSLKEEWRNAKLPPSRYEDPVRYSIVEGLTADLNEGARMSGRIPARWPVIGTLDTGRVNALTVRVPGTMECVIFLERQLLGFANLFAEAIAQAMPIRQMPEGMTFSHDPSDVAAHVRSDWSTVAHLGEVMVAFVATGLPMQAPQYFCEPSHEKLASWFRDSMELFVLGHEYAHVMLGHMADAETKPGLITVGSEVDLLAYSRQEELTADMLGMELGMLATLARNRLDPALCYSGVELFFCALELVERTKMVLLTGEDAEPGLESRSTHPSPRFRRLAAREMLNDLLRENQRMSAIELGKGLDMVAHTLWFFARDYIAKLHTHGVRPHAKLLLE